MISPHPALFLLLPVLAAGCSNDWPMWGGSPSRNMASDETGLPDSFDPGTLAPDGRTVDPSTTENVLWVANLGSQVYGHPTAAGGRVYVGTNNEGRNDPRFKGDHSILKCLDATTGEDLWILTVPKLGPGIGGDWEFLGICSSPAIAGDRVYVITNRCEVVALDVDGLADGNQGFQDEGHYMAYVGPYEGPGKKPPVPLEPTDADIIWRYDMRKELRVYPHNETASSVLVVGDFLFCSTSNGMSYDHTEIPFPKSPALIMLDRVRAEDPDATPAEILVGEEGSGLSKRILHANWTSPSYGEVEGRGMVFFGGPDGFLYAFDPRPVKDEDGYGVLPELWRYDCNPLRYRYRNGNRADPIQYASLGVGPSEVFPTPVFYRDRVYVGIGRDPEHGPGAGNFSCVDAKTGKRVWDSQAVGRTISTCSIADGRVYVSDFNGFIHCLDAETGRRYWEWDTRSEVWASTVVADGKLYLGNYDGDLTILRTEPVMTLARKGKPPLRLKIKRKALVLKRPDGSIHRIPPSRAEKYVKVVELEDPIQSPVTIADGVLYVATMTRLYAVKEAE